MRAPKPLAGWDIAMECGICRRRVWPVWTPFQPTVSAEVSRDEGEPNEEWLRWICADGAPWRRGWPVDDEELAKLRSGSGSQALWFDGRVQGPDDVELVWTHASAPGRREAPADPALDDADHAPDRLKVTFQASARTAHPEIGDRFAEPTHGYRSMNGLRRWALVSEPLDEEADLEGWHRRWGGKSPKRWSLCWWDSEHHERWEPLDGGRWYRRGSFAREVAADVAIRRVELAVKLRGSLRDGW